MNTVNSVNVVLVQGRPWSTTKPDTAITVIETSESGATLTVYQEQQLHQLGLI